MASFPLLQMFVILINFVILFSIVFAYPKNETTDVQALLHFKSKITNDPLQVMKSWNESTPFCQWNRVRCGKRHKRVRALYLYSSKIAGTISPYVGNLSFLRVLSLHNNSFTGNIPLEISRLHRLWGLSLGNNSLTGVIPFNMSNCDNLKGIFLSRNFLEGEIPADLGSLPKLTELRMEFNHLHGQIPPSLGNLTNLEVLYLGENKLSGAIPHTLGWLNRLEILSIEGNRLSGSIPPSIYNLSSLSVLLVCDNLIEGRLPPDLFMSLPNLRVFVIWQNQITGHLPASLSNASSMFLFDTSLNKFHGKIPSLRKLHELTVFQVDNNRHGKRSIDDLDFICSLTNNTVLQVLTMTNNNLGGTLPECVGNISSLLFLDMGENSIIGPIPTEIGNLINIEGLSVADNQFSGGIPSSIGKLGKLVKLSLSNNQLSGSIPSSLGNLKQLNVLSLENNKLQGAIPHTLGMCRSLNSLYLHDNHLVGTIPLEVFQISSLLEMNVSWNRLLGPIPELVENLDNLNLLDVSENMFSQAIPSSLGKCTNLQALYMQGNFFEGEIPPSLGSLRGINVVDLSRNNLSGQIPRSLERLIFLENLNLSYNNLEGQVPESGIFKNTSKFSITGNKKLCGGIPNLSLPKCNIVVSHKKSLHTTTKVVLCVLGGFLGISSLICILLSFWLRKKRNIVSQNCSSNHLLRLSYETLLKATNGFSSAKMLGSGSFGSVYRAVLDTSDKIVAVKVFDLQRHGASKSFLAECEVLKKIRHRNLLKILTACSSIDFSGNEFKALVYEFMANGNLEDWLHPFPTRECVSQPQKHLGLIERLNIAIDVACALDYLHHQCEIPIIHRDIKPSNVLLDDEMVGHVGDFGLSKILLDASNNNITSQISSIGFMGTIGYVAPEYGMGASLSTQGDIYSYGVLLLEMFTGKRPNDCNFQGSINLKCFVEDALPDNVAEIVDSTLHAEMVDLSNTGKTVLEYLIAIFAIGVSCSANLPSERKSIRDVIVELTSIRNKFLQTS